jgi:hypothetical protein
MKKNDLLLVAATALYSFLFYQQSYGINFLLFTLVLIILLIIRNKDVLQKKYWLLAAGGSILSGLCVSYYGNTLSFIANITSLSLLSAYSIGASSLLFALLFAFYSYASSLFFMFINRLEKTQEEETTPSPSVKRSMLIVIPVLIALLFFFMYRGSNILFNEFAKKINFDFISWSWIIFTLGGFILLYGFFRHRVISVFSGFDERAANEIDRQNTNTISLFGKKLSLADENFSGITLFILLNSLLLIVNGLDFNFLFVDGKLPAGLGYSEFVHQGIGMLITSILIAIFIILFYFRGALNFYEKSPLLKFLAYLWILQNVFMLFSTAMRNDMYIAEYGLTYKRIGVYVYLFLTAIGLCTTLLKVGQAKSNMFLFRINSWLFYGVLLASSLFNWDGIITDFNIHKANQLEKRYLVGLSYVNLPELYRLQADSLHKHREFDMASEEYSVTDSRTSLEYNFNKELSRKLFFFVSARDRTGWRSWSYLGQKVSSELEEMHVFDRITELDLRSCRLESLEGIQHFKALKKLNLFRNSISSLEGVGQLTQLEELDLSENPVTDYTPLYALKNLKVLHLDSLDGSIISNLRAHFPSAQISH